MPLELETLRSRFSTSNRSEKDLSTEFEMTEIVMASLRQREN